MAAESTSNKGGFVCIFDSGTPATGGNYSVGTDIRAAELLDVIIVDIGTDGNFDIELVNIASDGTEVVTKCFESQTAEITYTIANVPPKDFCRVVLNSITSGNFKAYLKRR